MVAGKIKIKPKKKGDTTVMVEYDPEVDGFDGMGTRSTVT